MSAYRSPARSRSSPAARAASASRPPRSWSPAARRSIVLDLDDDAVQRAAAQLGGGAIGIAADVTDRDAMDDVVATAVERFGGLDVIVANAGIASRGATALAARARTSSSACIEVNLLGVWRSVRAALPEIARRQGHVVVVASIYAFFNGVGAAPYAMAKAGVEQLGRALRVELEAARRERVASPTSATSTPRWSTRRSTPTRSWTG